MLCQKVLLRTTESPTEYYSNLNTSNIGESWEKKRFCLLPAFQVWIVLENLEIQSDTDDKYLDSDDKYFQN